MYNTKPPVKDKEYYYIWYTHWYTGEPYLSIKKVKLKKSWIDQEAFGYPKRIWTMTVIGNILNYNLKEIKVGDNITVDSAWNLQETLEDAYRVIIHGIFKGQDSFFNENPPFKGDI